MSNLKSTLAALGLFVAAGTLAIGVSAHHDPVDDSLAWYAMKQAAVGVQDAMNKAKVEQAGRIVNFESDDENGRLVYQFELLDSKLENEHEIKIDAQTGKVLSHEREKVDKWIQKSQGQEVLKASINMTEAFDKTYKLEPGMIIKAKFKMTMGVAVYVMDVIKEDKMVRLIIDAQSGERLPMLRSS